MASARGEKEARREERLDRFVYEQPGHLIRRANQMAWALFREETAELDVTPVQFSMLVAISDVPSIDATRLSELICIDRATVGNIVARLEARGFLTREVDTLDRRIKRLHVTPRGEEVIAAVCAVRARIGERLLSPLTRPERATFMRLVAKLVGMDEFRRRGHDDDA
ncbi:MarR family winged helix-turn-helix transcriptional regulator [Roseomonas chloroacetimidivorans]|uniref:MarR family winged helix-turn-helix transcriptional regulator n=1 Tax=Roseomonas chloroacetimidivorans TaxID=1766656 RepID=UPI003C717B35